MFEGIWCGVELNEPHGRHGGQVEGVRYFTCDTRHGIFAPAAKVVPETPQKPHFELFKSLFNKMSAGGEKRGDTTYDAESHGSMFNAGSLNDTFVVDQDAARGGHAFRDATFKMSDPREKSSPYERDLTFTKNDDGWMNPAFDVDLQSSMMDVDIDKRGRGGVAKAETFSYESSDTNAAMDSEDAYALKCEAGRNGDGNTTERRVHRAIQSRAFCGQAETRAGKIVSLTYEDLSQLPRGYADIGGMSSGRDDLDQLKVDLINGHHKRSTRPISLVSSVSTDTGYTGSEHGMLLSGYTADVEHHDILMTASGTGVDSDLTSVPHPGAANNVTLVNEMKLLTDTLDITMAIAVDADAEMRELSETESCSDITDYQTLRPLSEISDDAASLSSMPRSFPLDETQLSQVASESNDGSITDTSSIHPPDEHSQRRRLSSKRGSLALDRGATSSKIKKNIENVKQLEPIAVKKPPPPPPPPKKIIQRTMPKSKWNNIMSQIESNKDAKPKPKKAIKSRLSEIFTKSPPVPKLQPSSAALNVSSSSSSSLKSAKTKGPGKATPKAATAQEANMKPPLSVTPSEDQAPDEVASTQGTVDAGQESKGTRRSSLFNIPRRKSSTVLDQNRKSGRIKQNGSALKDETTASLSLDAQRLQAAREEHEKEVERLSIELACVTVGFDGMAVVVRYLTEQLDAFSCPALKSQLEALRIEINETRDKIASLQEQNVREIETLTQLHDARLEDLRVNQEGELMSMRAQLDQEHLDQLETMKQKHSREMQNLSSDHQEQMECLSEEQDMRYKQAQSDHHNGVLVLQEKHDSQMEELHQQHQNELTDMSQRFESIKTSLSEKIESLRCECNDLRIRARLSEEALLRESDIKVQTAIAPYLNVAAEVESLKSVVEMRNEEIRQIHKANIDLQGQLENLRMTEEKVISLSQKNENLEAIVNLKSDNEKQLTDKYQHLLKKVTRETRTNKRLSMDYEELRWRMTRSEDPSLADSMSSHIRRSPPATTAVANINPDGVVLRQKRPTSSPSARLTSSYENPKTGRRRESTPRRSLDAETELELMSPSRADFTRPYDLSDISSHEPSSGVSQDVSSVLTSPPSLP